MEVVGVAVCPSASEEAKLRRVKPKALSSPPVIRRVSVVEIERTWRHVTAFWWIFRVWYGRATGLVIEVLLLCGDRFIVQNAMRPSVLAVRSGKALMWLESCVVGRR